MGLKSGKSRPIKQMASGGFGFNGFQVNICDSQLDLEPLKRKGAEGLGVTQSTAVLFGMNLVKCLVGFQEICDSQLIFLNINAEGKGADLSCNPKHIHRHSV